MKFIPSRGTVAAGAKYLLLGGVVFAVGLVWNFPYERIRETLTAGLSRQTGYRFDVETLSPALPIGFVAKGARVLGPAIGDSQVDLELDRLKLTLSPATLLYPFRKVVVASYTADRKKDRFWGSVSLGRERSALEFQTKNFKFEEAFPLGQIDPMLTSSELKLAGSLTADLSVGGLTQALQQTDFSLADGEVTLTGANITIEAPVLKSISFDKVTVEAVLQKGTLNVKSIALTGPEMTAKGSGSVKIEPFYRRSQINLEAKITIDPKANNLKTIFELFAAQKGLKADSAGAWPIRIAGSLDRPDLRSN
jgi:type II secretion system protein N